MMLTFHIFVLNLDLLSGEIFFQDCVHCSTIHWKTLLGLDRLVHNDDCLTRIDKSSF